MINDKERFDWLEKNGQGYAVVSDDNGHWACVAEGMQNCTVGDDTEDIQTAFFIEKNEWFNTIREAIDSVIKEYKKFEDEEVDGYQSDSEKRELGIK